MTFNQKPDFYNHKTFITLAHDSRVELYLDINNNEMIKGIGFQGESLSAEVQESLDKDCLLLIDNSIHQIKTMKFSHPYSFLSFQAFYRNFTGEKVLEKTKLLCRCFNISAEDVHAKTEEGKLAKEIIFETKASTGCRSCKFDIYDEILKNNKKVRRYKDIPNAEWLIKVQDLIDNFISYEQDYKTLSPEVMDFKAGLLKVSLDKSQTILRTKFEMNLSLLVKEKVDSDIICYFS